MAGKLMPSRIHLLDDSSPCWCGIDSSLAVVDTSDEKRSFGTIGIQKINHAVGVLVRAIIECQGDVTGIDAVINFPYIEQSVNHLK